MKKLQICVIVVFLLVLLVPVSQFNFEEHAASAIDNRMLTDNPFKRPSVTNEVAGSQEDSKELDDSFEEEFTVTYTTKKDANAKRTIHSYPSYAEEVSLTSQSTSNLTGDLTKDLENYVNDRIGFRDEMILGYTLLNDRLFGKMIHPAYTYGKEGYVFGTGLWVNEPYTEYHETFADMVLNIQTYCESRGVPFLFAFNAVKPAIYTEYLPEGMNYDRTWVDAFLQALDERGVHYVDTTAILREKKEQGEEVMNQKYNANHWNDIGAYYGTYAILDKLKERVPSIHLTSYDELSFSTKLQTTLQVSEFPIHEEEPVVSLEKMDIQSCMKGAIYDELYRNRTYATCLYNVNEQRKTEGAPRALVFQGSYMNGFGYKFFSNAFSEYISVHNYQNVIDFEYYYSIFHPECVIFEVTENCISDTYFNWQRMQDMDLNPFIEDVDEKNKNSSVETISVTEHEALTSFLWPCDTDDIDFAWITVGEQTYDMYRTESGFEVTLKTEDYLQTTANK